VTVRISPRPSRMLADTPGASCSSRRAIADRLLSLAGVAQLPGLAQHPSHCPIHKARNIMEWLPKPLHAAPVHLGQEPIMSDIVKVAALNRANLLQRSSVLGRLLGRPAAEGLPLPERSRLCGLRGPCPAKRAYGLPVSPLLACTRSPDQRFP
jgi:hypothetical protein